MAIDDRRYIATLLYPQSKPHLLTIYIGVDHLLCCLETADEAVVSLHTRSEHECFDELGIGPVLGEGLDELDDTM